MSRILAVLIASCYLCGGLFFGGLLTGLQIAPVLCLLLACIVWPEYMAELKGPQRREPLPQGLIVGLAWFLLLLPAILAGVVWLML
jgi:hypothetical protein